MMHKRLVAGKIMKSGASRIKILDAKQVEEALTRQDIRNLIRKGVIIKVQKKGSSKSFSRHNMAQKKKGRRRGPGTRKGTYKTRNPKKEMWMKTVRPLRSLLNNLVVDGQVDKSNNRALYNMIKGGAFRDKSHLINYLKDHDMLKKRVVSKKVGKV